MRRSNVGPVRGLGGITQALRLVSSCPTCPTIAIQAFALRSYGEACFQGIGVAWQLCDSLQTPPAGERRSQSSELLLIFDNERSRDDRPHLKLRKIAPVALNQSWYDNNHTVSGVGLPYENSRFFFSGFARVRAASG